MKTWWLIPPEDHPWRHPGRDLTDARLLELLGAITAVIAFILIACMV